MPAYQGGLNVENIYKIWDKEYLVNIWKIEKITKNFNNEIIIKFFSSRLFSSEKVFKVFNDDLNVLASAKNCRNDADAIINAERRKATLKINFFHFFYVYRYVEIYIRFQPFYGPARACCCCGSPPALYTVV